MDLIGERIKPKSFLFCFQKKELSTRIDVVSSIVLQITTRIFSLYNFIEKIIAEAFQETVFSFKYMRCTLSELLLLKPFFKIKNLKY